MGVVPAFANQICLFGSRDIFTINRPRTRVKRQCLVYRFLVFVKNNGFEKRQTVSESRAEEVILNFVKCIA